MNCFDLAGRSIGSRLRVDIDVARLRLLWLCAWPGPPGAAAAPLFDGLDEQGWTQLIACADEETLLSWTIMRIDACGAPCPSHLRAVVEQRYATRRRWNRILAVTGDQLIDRLSKRGIQARLLKGAPLSAVAYGDSTARDTRDIDILVDPEHLAAASDALIAEDFECQIDPWWLRDATLLRNHREISFFKLRGAVEVDLHWRLSNPWVPLEQPEPTIEELALVPLPNHGAAGKWFSPNQLTRLSRINLANASTVDLKSIVDVLRCEQLANSNGALAALMRPSAGSDVVTSPRSVASRTLALLHELQHVVRLPAKRIASEALAPQHPGAPGTSRVWLRHLRRVRKPAQLAALIRSALSPSMRDYAAASQLDAVTVSRSALARKAKRRV